MAPSAMVAAWKQSQQGKTTAKQINDQNMTSAKAQLMMKK